MPTRWNSTGNFHEWWDLFERLPHCQGGFIWDWVDQGLDQPLPELTASAASSDAAKGKAAAAPDGSNGKGATPALGGAEAGDSSLATRWAYGGDWGDRQHDARFCINGLLAPDRRPHPGLAEVKHAMQPVKIELEAWSYREEEEEEEAEEAERAGAVGGGMVAAARDGGWSRRRGCASPTSSHSPPSPTSLLAFRSRWTASASAGTPSTRSVTQTELPSPTASTWRRRRRRRHQRRLRRQHCRQCRWIGRRQRLERAARCA